MEDWIWRAVSSSLSRDRRRRSFSNVFFAASYPMAETHKAKVMGSTYGVGGVPKNHIAFT